MSIADLFSKIVSLTNVSEIKEKVLAVARRELAKDKNENGIPDLEEKIDAMFANQSHLIGYIVHAIYELLLDVVQAGTVNTSSEAEVKAGDSLSDFVTETLGN